MHDTRAELSKDHQELEQLLRRLSDDSSAPEPAALLTTWCEFETRLLAHMDAEERYLLPLLDASHPADTARTRAEHARIRQLVSELGVAIELHAARKPAIVELITALRDHAEAEERSLYPLGSERASTLLRHQISAALSAAARFAIGARTGRVAGGATKPPGLP